MKATTNKSNISMSDLFKFAAKDKKRLALTGVHHDSTESVAVVTDAITLVVSEGAYNPGYSGKTINKEGGVIDCSYPHWKRIIDDVKERNTTKVDIDLSIFSAEIEKIYKGWKALQKSPTFKEKAAPLDGIMILIGGNRHVYLSVERLYKIFAVQDKLGITTLLVSANDPHLRAVLFQGEGKNCVLLMPVLYHSTLIHDARFIYDVQTNTLTRGLDSRRVFGCSVADEYFDEVMGQVKQELSGIK